MNALIILSIIWGSFLFIVNHGQLVEKKEVVIVGGGMAGMAAARALLNKGEYNVKVLEARSDRYGGRIWTNRQIQPGLKGVDVEMGAAFLNTRAKPNKLIKLANDFELQMENSGLLQVVTVNENGDREIYSGANATTLYTETFKTLIEALNAAKQEITDRPVRDVFFEAVGLNGDQNEHDDELTIVQQITKSLPAVTMQNFSSALYDIYNDFGWDRILVDGVSVLLDRIVAGSGTELPVKIEMNKVVRNIKVDDKRQKVLIRTTDRKQIIADAVVLALPVGVLKSGSVIFDPPLSRDWYKSIKSLGIDYSTKIIVGFKEAFWPKDVGIFNIYSKTASDGFLQTWINSYRISGNPVLIGKVSGEKAKLWETQPEIERKHMVKKVLGEIFGEDIVNSHDMTIFVHSNWSTDEFTLGTTSYPQVGNTPEMWKTLQQPVCPYIYFAGAHTEADTHIDSLHGAYDSGIRASQQIINSICETKKKSANKKQKTKSKNKDEL
ncbi:hypothetical protein ACF0H5_002132 [Mactra antiquata]